MNEQNRRFIPNPFEKLFMSLIPKSVSEKDAALIKNSLTTSESEMNSRTLFPGNAMGFEVNNVTFDAYFSSKENRIFIYRGMKLYPEIADAIDTILDEAIVESPLGKIVDLNFVEDDKVPETIQKKAKEVADYIFNDVLRVRENLSDYFKKWLVDGELYLEKIISEDKKHIVAVKTVPAFRIFPYYERGIIRGFIHGPYDPQKQYKREDIKFPREQIAYVNYGEFTNGDLYKPEGFLEPAVKTYNMLRQMEDAVVIYRISRASERLVFNVEVGNLSPQKAESAITKLINKYRKNIVYDPSTGLLSQAYNSMALHENYFFPQSDGKGSAVTQLPGAQNLSELGDIQLFQKKLYKALKIPKSRWQDNQIAVFNSRPGEIEREEMKFNSFIRKLQNRFKRILLDLIISEMKLRNVGEKYLDPDLYDIAFTKNNYYSEFKDLQLMEEKLSILNAASPSMISKDNLNGILSTEYVLKNILQMDDEDYKENEKLLKKEKKKLEKEAKEEAMAQQSDLNLQSVDEIPFPNEEGASSEGLPDDEVGLDVGPDIFND